MPNEPASTPRFKLPPLFWIGCALLVIGIGPLLAVAAAASLGLTRDPDPNPIGLGLLAFVAFWPSVIMMGAGLVLSAHRYRIEKRAQRQAR